MLAPFSASRLKINRATQHTQELQREITVFFERNPFKLVVYEVEDRRSSYELVSWNVRLSRLLPVEVSAIIGDIVHNARVALDVLACDLVALAGHSTKGVYFPFCESADELVGMIKRRNVHRASKEAVKLFHSMEPYRGGNVKLRLIHDMDIRDKHSAIIVALGAAGTEILKDIPDIAEDAMKSFSSAILGDNQMLVMMPKAWSPPVGTELPLKFGVIFGQFYQKGCPLQGNEVVTTLHGLVQEVKSVIEAFAALYPEDVLFEEAAPEQRVMMHYPGR